MHRILFAILLVSTQLSLSAGFNVPDFKVAGWAQNDITKNVVNNGITALSHDVKALPELSLDLLKAGCAAAPGAAKAFFDAMEATLVLPINALGHIGYGLGCGLDYIGRNYPATALALSLGTAVFSLKKVNDLEKEDWWGYRNRIAGYKFLAIASVSSSAFLLLLHLQNMAIDKF